MSSFFDTLYSRLVFPPTLLWNMLLGRWLKIRNWWDPIDKHVVLGAFPFASDVEKLAKLGVKAVVNTCEEYAGPQKQYAQHQIEQFRMPTIDFTHPKLDDVTAAVEFIESHVGHGRKVYIHCKAGRGRSATVAICWLMKAKGMNMIAAQEYLLEQRPHVNSRLTKRPVVQAFASNLMRR